MIQKGDQIPDRRNFCVYISHIPDPPGPRPQVEYSIKIQKGARSSASILDPRSSIKRRCYRSPATGVPPRPQRLYPQPTSPSSRGNGKGAGCCGWSSTVICAFLSPDSPTAHCPSLSLFFPLFPPSPPPSPIPPSLQSQSLNSRFRASRRGLPPSA